MSAEGGAIALPSVSKRVTEEQIRAYAQASGDFNSLHLDKEFAATTQFEGIIAHGMLTLAFVNEMLTRAFGKSWLESGKLRVRFKAAAHPGDEVTTSGAVTKEQIQDGQRLVECVIYLKNQRGQELISGMATVKLHTDKE